MNARTLIFLLLWANAAAALELRATVNPQTATIGDHLQYEITAKGPGATDIPLKIEDPTPFEVLSAKAANDKGDKRTVFTLVTFKTGKITLPAYTVTYADPEGKKISVTAPAVSVEICSVLPAGEKDPKLMDIEKEVEAHRDWKEYLVPAGIALALLAAALAVYYLIRRKAPLTAAVKPRPPLPPYELAMQGLERIRRENLFSEGKVKEYFSGISDTVREYLHGEYGIDAPERTTLELERIWPPMLQPHAALVFSMLRLCDAAKFARSVPSAEAAAEALSNATEFVQSSPKVKSVPAAGLLSEGTVASPEMPGTVPPIPD